MSKNEKNLGSYGVPSFDTGENPYFDYPAAPLQQGQQAGFPGGPQGGFPQGGFAPGGAGIPMQGGQMPGMGMMPMQGGQMPGMGMMPTQGGMMPPQVPSGGGFPGQVGGQPFQEESYIENILRLNRGKMATVYMTFENNSEWNAKVFKGIVEAAGRDHIVLSDPQTGRRYLLLMVYLNYITFDEELNYEYPFA